MHSSENEIPYDDVPIAYKDMKTKRPEKYNQRPMNDHEGYKKSLEYDIRILILLEELAKSDSSNDMQSLFAEYGVGDVSLGETMPETIKNIKKRKEDKQRRLATAGEQVPAEKTKHSTAITSELLKSPAPTSKKQATIPSKANAVKPSSIPFPTRPITSVASLHFLNSIDSCPDMPTTLEPSDIGVTQSNVIR